MKRYDKITPASTRDLLFDECEALRTVRESLRTLFAEHGFREVMTPSLEFYDLFEHSYGQVLPGSMLKTTDSQNRLLCMRPDCTVPIARLVATKLSQAQPPIRLFYDQQVYCAPKEHAGKAAELWQVGVELIGTSAGESDVSILQLAAQSLSKLGGGFSMEICHIGFFKALIASLDAPEAVKGQVRALIEQKNEATLRDVLAPYKADPAARALWTLPRLSGSGEVLDAARALTGESGALLALKELSAVFSALQESGMSEHITIDLGLVNKAEYYTGLIFRGFLPGLGEPVLSGGRYDRMLAQFGRDLPAVGFGVNASLISQMKITGDRQARSDGEITLALTKGRLERASTEMLAALGYDCSELYDKGRRLVLTLGNSGVRVILAKAADVITYVESGVADIGVVGKDTIMENGGEFYEVLDLGFGRCRFALACQNADDVFSGYRTKVIASKYPKVALRFFHERGLDVEIVKIEGSVELAPLVGLADGIVDIVETGSTLKENGLSVVQTIAPVSARMIVNTASMKLKSETIGAFIQSAETYISEKNRQGEGE